LKYAGGFTGDAFKKAVRLTRQSGERYSVYNVDEFEMSSFQVEDGDAVVVDGMLNRYENMVEVKGAVFRPGQYQLGKEVTSVRTLLQAAEGVTEDAFTARGVMHRMKEDRSLEVIAVDVKGILAGTAPDIPLKNEDVLFIPTQTDLRSERTLTITGEVMSPGTYQYADNTTLEDLVLQAGGLTDAASTVKVDVSRRIRDPKAHTSSKEIAKTYSFSLKDGFVVDGLPGFTLEPYDVVHVRKSPGFQTPRNIRVEGEVLYEGVQTLANKNQRLSDAIKMAGGVTSEAYTKGARLERKLNDDEKARRRFLLKQLRAQAEDKDTVDYDQLDLGETYTVGIYLDKALENPGSEFDVILREGDRIVVPEYNGVVKISGNVMYPNTVSYQEGKKYKWYINQAGGFGNRAKKSKTFIVYQNGTMAQVGHGTKIEPGCEIIVPTKSKVDYSHLTQLISIGSSLTSLAAMIAVIAKR
jgi:protein involved in polysaccharide export with SLBB domain